jgi:hypothetical protein
MKGANVFSLVDEDKVNDSHFLKNSRVNVKVALLNYIYALKSQNKKDCLHQRFPTGTPGIPGAPHGGLRGSAETF